MAEEKTLRLVSQLFRQEYGRVRKSPHNGRIIVKTCTLLGHLQWNILGHGASNADIS